MPTIIGWSRPVWVRRINGAGSTLLRGEAVVEAGGGTVVRATHANTGAKHVLGVMAEDVANGVSGVVYLFGDVRVRVTALPAVGDRMFLSATAGLMAATLGSTDPVVEVGTVTSTAMYTPESPLVTCFVHKMPRTG